MNGNRHLTLLQHGVIRRLKDAGFIDLARKARTHWSRGEPIDEFPREEQYGARAGEFARANQQAERIGRPLPS